MKAGFCTRFCPAAAPDSSRHGRKNADFLLYSKPNEKSEPVARLQTNVIAGISKCDGSWCRISGEGFDGYIQQANLWGAYPNEKIE